MRLLILTLILMTACKKEEKCAQNPHDPVIYTLRAEDTVCLPYTGNDTLVFEVADSNGTILDTAFFKGNGKKYLKKWLFDRVDHVSGCQKEHYGVGYQINYQSDIVPHILTLVLETREHDATFKIYMKASEGQYSYTLTTDDLRGEYGYHYTSRTIAGKLYWNIIQACEITFQKVDQCYKYPCMVNKGEGILFIKLKNGLTFSRLMK